jgi:hypothetical protein
MTSSNLKSNRPNRLLVAVDGSDISMNAADYAITLAKNNNNNETQEAMEIIIINVIDIFLQYSRCSLLTRETN